MKKLLPLLTLSMMMFAFAGLQAQPCSTPPDITLSTQAEVDSFQTNYGPCNVVTENLTIQGAGITNLDSLYQITSIGGFIRISVNDNLTHLDGLSNLTSVGGYLAIYNNATLANVDGLSNLTSVGGFLFIGGNLVLTNLDGLSNIASVGGDLQISDNGALALCCGVFPLLDGGNIGGNIFIQNNFLDCNSETDIIDACTPPPVGCIPFCRLSTFAQPDA